MGATLVESGCSFRVWAPHAERVAVMGSFNDWRDDEFPLTAEPDGIWHGEVPGVRAGDEYLYVIDNRGGDRWNPGQRGLRRIDPWARATRGSHGNAIVVDVEGELASSGLQDDPFVTPSAADWLVYQVHIGSFVGGGDAVNTGPTATGTFRQFEQKLGHISSLGFNAIALLPVHQNPGDGNEGYGPSHLFAPESSFGSPADLRHLVRAAHDIGLAVLFDVVWNHMSDIDNSLWEFDGMTRQGGIFFEGGERSPWGPRLASWKREVREFIVANARMCFAEYHADGFRVDAADEIPRDVLAEVVRSIRAEPAWNSRMLIAEWTGTDAGSAQLLIDEVGFDRVWALGDPHVFVAAVDELADPATRASDLEQLILLPDAPHRIRYLLGSHDTGHDNEGGARPRFRHFVERAGGRENWHARAKARMGWVLCVSLPGTPMCFMGAECLQPGYWHPRPDANPLHGDHRFDWTLCADATGVEMRALVAAANGVRWQQPALRAAGIELVHADPLSGVVAFERAGGGDDVMLVVVNASDSSWPDGGYRMALSPRSVDWRMALDSQAGLFGGDGLQHAVRWNDADGVLELTVPRWSAVIYSRSCVSH